ncbi:DUF397 domain-containing protein [Actinokineospora sp. NBRC 105648]|uniref:DUF397 domain-containing protein n=1 Tax=Actinokineospora sp. NBRC 105648 TaxID=3032206 RepID=UPI0024A2C4D0|nr:DUF397 domain-containing protein [Actinokineospora sp. NBRC 105648]GLZ39518.1 toxin [Actinokineospora sp. NBRC 105648]
MTNESQTAWADADFRKSSFSGGQNGACVELAWRKSSFSGGENGACVEIAHAEDLFGVRDSKNTTGPVLELSASQGHAFLTAIRTSQLTA